MTMTAKQVSVSEEKALGLSIVPQPKIEVITTHSKMCSGQQIPLS
jgi:hypothetical protein